MRLLARVRLMENPRQGVVRQSDDGAGLRTQVARTEASDRVRLEAAGVSEGGAYCSFADDVFDRANDAVVVLDGDHGDDLYYIDYII